MSKTLMLSLVIGASLKGMSNFGTAKSMLDGLKLKTDELTTAQHKLGKSITDALSHGSFAASLRGQYQSLGDDIKRLTTQYDRLSNSMLKSKHISERRRELYGKMVEVGAQAYGVGMPVIKSVRAAANVEDIVRDISITGNFNQAEEKQLTAEIRKNSLAYNQSPDQLGDSLKNPYRRRD